jgi:hypothetical protein
VDADTGDAVVPPDHLGRVDAGSDLGAERGERVSQVTSGAHASARPVERRQQPVAGKANQLAPAVLHAAAGGGGEVIQQAGMTGVADVRLPLTAAPGS